MRRESSEASGEASPTLAQKRSLSKIAASYADDVHMIRRNTSSLVRSTSNVSQASEESNEDLCYENAGTGSANAGGSMRNRRAPRGSLTEGVLNMKRTVTSGSRKSLLQALSVDGSGRNFVDVEREAEEFGPVVDVQILVRGQKCPSGYQRVMQIGKNQAADLNKGNNSKGLYLCFKRGHPEAGHAPITGLVIVHENKEEFVPPGYEIVGTYVGNTFVADLSLGQNGSAGRVFLCMSRGEGAPLVDICAVHPSHRELLPDEYGIIERTPLGFSALLNSRTKNAACFLCLKRDSSHLQLLSKMSKESSSEHSIPLFTAKSAKGNGQSSIPASTRGTTWKDHVTKEGILQADLQPEELASLTLLLAGCYAADVSCVIVALRGLEQAVKSLDKLFLKPFASSQSAAKQMQNGLIEVILKAASDATQLGVDVTFPAALKVVLAVVERCEAGLTPCAMHFVLKTIARCSCFFRIHPMKTYTWTSPHRRSSTHQFGALGAFDSMGSQNERALGMASARTKSHDPVDNLLESISCITLEDMNFLLRCPSMIFDVLVHRASINNVAPSSVGSETTTPSNNGENASDNADFIRNNIIYPMIDGACEIGSTMDITEQASRRLAKHTSENASFSSEIHEQLSQRLPLTSVAEENALATLVWLSQASAMLLTSPLRKGRLFNSEMNLKVAHMQLLREFLGCVGPVEDGFFAGHIFAYQVRKFTFEAIIYNASNMKRLDLSLPVLSELWKNMRQHLKIEFALVLEKLLLFVLRDKYTPPQLRRECLTHMLSLFGMHPGDLVQLFLNFENDPVVTNWRTFENLVEVLCQLTDPSMYLQETDVTHRQINKDTQYDALASLVTLLRSLTDMSGTFRLMQTDATLRKRSSQAMQALEFYANDENDEAYAGHDSAGEAKTKVAEALVRTRQKERQNASREFEQAFQLSQKSKNAGKAIKYLSEAGLLQTTPTQISIFLHLYHKELGERSIGNYLGSRSNDEVMNHIRFAFVSALPFAGKSFEQCLRMYLEKGHFFLPGEGQQVEALMDSFAEWFVNQNQDEFSKKDQDMIMLLAFTTIMLNTDLHNPNVNKKKRMTQEQFLKQISLIENGDRISQEFGVRLYKSVQRKEIKFATEEDNLDTSSRTYGATREKVVQSGPATSSIGNYVSPSGMSSLSSNAGGAASVVSSSHSSSDRASTDMSSNSEFSGEDLQVSDSIREEINMAAALGAEAYRARSNEQTITRQKANSIFQRKLASSVGTMHSLTCAFSTEWRTYNNRVTREAVKVMFEIVWVHFFSVVTKILERPKVFSLDAVSHALDILSHCISISLFLGMEEERKAFAMLLAKVHYLYTNNTAESINSLGVLKGEHLKDKWYTDVMSASCASRDVIDVINEVHHLTSSMKEMIVERQSREVLIAIQKRFDGHVSLVEPGRRFLREGVLSKKGRNTKFRKYQFFLFSDVLLYASQRTLTGSKLHVHQQLNLHTMQVRESSIDRVFEIRHPRKSFVVQTRTDQERLEWMREIKYAIDAIYLEQLSAPSPSVSAMEQADVMARDLHAARSLGTGGNNARSYNTGQPSRGNGRAMHRAGLGDSGGEREDLEVDSDDDDSIHDPKAFECDIEDDDEEDEEDICDADSRSEDECGCNLIDFDQRQGLDEDGMQLMEDTGTLTGAMRTRRLGKHDQIFNKGEDQSSSLSRLRTESSSSPNPIQDNDRCQRRPSMEDIQSLPLETKNLWLESLATHTGDADPAMMAMPSHELHQKFVVGLRFAKPILTSSHVRFVATDEQKLLMYGYFKQSTQGKCAIDEPSSEDWVSYSKYKVWHSLGTTSKDEAKRLFLSILAQVAPGWSEGSASVATVA